MPKPNARTFRYSDEVKNILEKYNNDFDSLVVEAFLRLPEAEKKRDEINNQCLELLSKRDSLLKDIRNLETIISSLNNLKRSIDYYSDSIKKM
ncbi:MAG: hypothetical protein ACI4KI_06180 [Candidatus Fimenecus sp.]